MRRKKGDISITYMSGPLDGKTMTFPQPGSGQQKIITIGRREGCDIHMTFDNQVSRLHARLICEAQQPDIPTAPLLLFWLEDGGSRNGTFVEKLPDPIEERVSLRPGMLFRIGRTWMRLDVPLSFGG